MNATIQQDVVRRLVQDFEFKEQDKYLQQGVCLNAINANYLPA